MKAPPDWRAYLERLTEADRIGNAPDILLDPTGFALWQRFMHGDCLALATAVASHRRLPLGRLMRGDGLAHAFVILTDGEQVPDRWLCLDWSGIRSLKRVRDDMRDAWGRLVFDWSGLDARRDPMPLRDRRAVLRLAKGRSHIAWALRVEWPRTAPHPHLDRLRYLDVIDVEKPGHSPIRHVGVPRRHVDVIDVRTTGSKP